jgi:hypothetical protein
MKSIGSLSPPPYATGSSMPAPAEHLTPFRERLMTLLGIPVRLTVHNDRNICIAYKKYQAFLQASQTLSKMFSDGSWPGKKPSSMDLIEVFVSKSMWFSHYKPAFSKVADFPEMVLWLEDSDEKGTDLDVWGAEKGTYSLMDLCKFVDNGTLVVVEKKGKGKKKEVLEEGSGMKSKKKVINNVGQRKGGFKLKQK